jgi:hypothetical protein
MKKFICIAQANSSSLVPRNPPRPHPDRADVVDQHVNLTVLLDRTLDQLRRPACRGQVNGHGGDPFVTVESAGGMRAGDDRGALAGQRPGDGQPDALARAGDHRHLAVQLEVHIRLPFGISVTPWRWPGGRRWSASRARDQACDYPTAPEQQGAG